MLVRRIPIVNVLFYNQDNAIFYDIDSGDRIAVKTRPFLEFFHSLCVISNSTYMKGRESD